MSLIIIEDPILEGKRLTSKVTFPKQLENIYCARAWITGSNLYIKTIDGTFKESMEELHNFFSKIFPKISTSTEIKTEKMVENKIKVDNF